MGHMHGATKQLPRLVTRTDPTQGASLISDVAWAVVRSREISLWEATVCGSTRMDERARGPTAVYGDKLATGDWWTSAVDLTPVA